MPRIERPNPIFQSFVVDQLVGALLAEAIDGSELAPGEFGVLSAADVLGPIMPSELAQVLGMPPTTLSAHIRRFSERGLVARTPNPRDGRSYLLSVTPAGRARVDRARVGLHETLAAISRHLEVGEEQLREALSAFERALRAIAAERAESNFLRSSTN